MFFRRIKLFALFGFQVWVDVSWLLLAALIAWSLAVGVFPKAVPELSAATYWWMAIAVTLGLLLSIVLHETAHSLVARLYGIEIRGITLFIFGGVAEMPDEPKSARAEFLMALAGPMASIALAGFLFALYTAANSLQGMQAVAEVLWYLGFLNASLGIFNLVPAFPLDGGRMLRAALWGWRGDIAWATRIAANAGNAFGILLIISGVLQILVGNFIGGMWQFLIGTFLRGAAGASYQQTLAQRMLAGVSVAQVMTANPIAVPPNLPISDFIENYVYRYHHREFPVAHDGALAGLIGTKQAAALDRSLWRDTPVFEIQASCTATDTIASDAPALAALTQMRRAGRNHLFVLQDGRLVGVISLRDLIDLLSVKLEVAGDFESGFSAGAARRA